MEFRLDPEQLELQQTVARLFEAGAAWSTLAEVGVFDVLELGLLEAALVFEQVGEHLVPGPLLWTALARPLVDDAVVGGVEVGEDVVEHAADLDRVLVLHPDRVTAHAVEAVEPLEPLDPLTPVGRVRLGPGTDLGDAADLRRQGTVLSAAILVGLSSRALTIARDHALEREQFGVPIGSFQAVKHLLADRYVANGLAQSATYAAAAEPDDRSAAVAKLLATEAALEGAATAIQVLGGMGFTWDMPTNHLLKRAWVHALSFGAADDHALALGTALVAGR